MKKSGIIAASLPALLLAHQPSPAMAQENNAVKTKAYQNSVAQDQLRTQTRRLREEMSRMLEEFRNNPSATAEIAQAEAAMEKLAKLSDQEMLEVVQSLREASRSDGADAKNKLVSASADQKNIQATLRLLSDKMALFKDETSIQQRINELVLRQLANQRQTRNLSDGTVRDWEVKTVFPVALSEQDAIRTEVHLFLETLKQLAENPAVNARQTFAAMLASSQSARIEPLTDASSKELAAKNFPEALGNEGLVVAALQGMIEILNKARSGEERLQAAAAKMKELAALQKQLANNSVKTFVYQMNGIQEKQQDIIDEVTAIEKEINQLSPQANIPLEEARKSMENIDQAMNGKDFKKSEANRIEVAESQKGIGDKLEAVAGLLQKKADELAGNSSASPAPGASDSADAKAMQAINAAAGEVMKAQNDIAMAKQMMGNPENVEAAKSHMGDAQSALADAEKALEGAAGAVDWAVGENLNGAGSDMAKSKAEAGSDTKQEKSRWGLDRAGEKTAAALKGLQDAANALAAKGGAGSETGKAQAGKGQPGQSQPGKSGGKFDGNVAGGGGSPGNTPQEDTDFSALSKLSDKERMALSMLQREKAPAEYSTMVQQYLKNLAEGEMPGQ